jgi:hypothetical protein
MKRSPGGPGLAKAHRAPLLNVRTLRLVACSDARWGELFETADVVSEGALHGGPGERAYYGSTDIVLMVTPERSGESIATLAKAASVDPHVRLRAVRLARREAAQRATGPLDRLHAEVSISGCVQGISVHVEVEAKVLPERRARPRAPKLAEGDGVSSARGVTLAGERVGSARDATPEGS